MSFTFTVPNVAERDLVISALAEGGSGSGPGDGAVLSVVSVLSCNKAAAAVSQKRELKRRLLEAGNAASMRSTMAVSRVIESGSAK